MSPSSLLSSLAGERARALDRAALAAAQVGALAWFSPRTPGLPLDDAWIHQVVARTFAETGTLGYAPGQHGAGATSYLWAALLAINLKVLHLAPEKWSLLLAGGSTLASGQLLHGILFASRPTPIDALAWRVASFGAAAATMLSAHVLWFAHAGMEASTLIALSLGAISLATRPSARASVWAGVLAGLLALLRPEAAALGGLLLLEALLREKKVTPRHVRLGAPWIAALVIYVGSNVVKAGNAMPATLSGRRWLWFEGSAGLSHMGLVAEQAVAWLDRLCEFAVGRAHLSSLWIALGLAAFGAYRLVRDGSVALRLLFGWGAFHTLFYVLMLPTPGHGGRYQPLVPMLFTMSALMGGVLVLWDASRRRRAALAAFATAPWLGADLQCARDLRERNDLAVAHVEATEIGMGRKVAALPAGAVVASFDIGGIGWAAGRRVLDLGGLSDPKVAAQLEQGMAWRWLADNKVEYVVLPEGYGDETPEPVSFEWRLHLRDNDAVRLEPIASLETRLDRWLPGVEATWNSAPRQVLHRVTYTGKKPPRDPPPVARDARRPIADPASLAAPADRIRAERALGVLEAWGVPIDVVASHERPEPDNRSVCRVSLGPFGVALDGPCGGGAARALVVELVRLYVDAGDFGGALRMVPHALARARRMTERDFYPSLPPLGPPMLERPGDVVRASVGDGIWLAVATLALGLTLTWVGRRRTFVSAALPASALLFACRREPDLPEAAGWTGFQVERAHGDVELRGARGRTSLLVAADVGDPEVVAKLLARGAKADAQDDSGATALHLAARRGATDALVLLARATPAAAIDQPAGPRKRTALLDAANANVEARGIAALLAAGASIDRAGSDGETVLHALARADASRSSAIAPLLLERGADVMRADDRSFTPLHAAAAHDNVVLARALSSPTTIVATTASGETPLDVARRYRRDRVGAVLFDAGASPREGTWPPLHDAARMNDVSRVAALLGAGADPKRVWADRTPLGVALERGSKEAADLLAAAGAGKP